MNTIAIAIDTIPITPALPKISFARGETVRIKDLIEAATGYYFSPWYYVWNFTIPKYYWQGVPIPHRVIVAVMDNNRMPVFFGYTNKTIYYGIIQETVHI